MEIFGTMVLILSGIIVIIVGIPLMQKKYAEAIWSVKMIKSKGFLALLKVTGVVSIFLGIWLIVMGFSLLTKL